MNLWTKLSGELLSLAHFFVANALAPRNASKHRSSQFSDNMDGKIMMLVGLL